MIQVVGSAFHLEEAKQPLFLSYSDQGSKFYISNVLRKIRHQNNLEFQSPVIQKTCDCFCKVKMVSRELGMVTTCCSNPCRYNWPRIHAAHLPHMSFDVTDW